MRLLHSSCHPGARQMAIDSLLLDQRAPAFRLYTWQHPTLSLGVHQRCIEPHWQALAAAGVIDLVRRPSGGRAEGQNPDGRVQVRDADGDAAKVPLRAHRRDVARRRTAHSHAYPLNLL
jgi:hypothetical protein